MIILESRVQMMHQSSKASKQTTERVYFRVQFNIALS